MEEERKKMKREERTTYGNVKKTEKDKRKGGQEAICDGEGTHLELSQRETEGLYKSTSGPIRLCVLYVMSYCASFFEHFHRHMSRGLFIL